MSRNRTIYIVSCYAKGPTDDSRFPMKLKSFRTLKKASQYAIKMSKETHPYSITLRTLKVTPSSVYFSVSRLEIPYFEEDINES